MRKGMICCLIRKEKCVQTQSKILQKNKIKKKKKKKSI